MFIFTLWSLYPKENIPRTRWIGSWWLEPSESGYDGEEKILTILKTVHPHCIVNNQKYNLPNPELL
jgi:hypothetical protein